MLDNGRKKKEKETSFFFPKKKGVSVLYGYHNKYANCVA